MWMRKIAACVVAMGVSATAWAAVPSDAEVDELLRVSRVPELINNMMQGMEKELTESAKVFADVSGVRPDAAQSRRVQEMQRKVVRVLREEMAWEKVQPIYRQIYQETFTQEEVAGMLAFYRTPVGQSVVQKTPQVMERSMQITRERLMPTVVRRIGQVMRETGDAKDDAKGGVENAARGRSPATGKRN